MIKRVLASAALMFMAASCAHVTVDPIEVKPITATINVNLKVDHELDQFFAFENKTPTTSTTTQSAGDVQ